MRIRSAIKALILTLAMTTGAAPSSAQDEDACREECRALQEQCVTNCGEHSDPMECESDCSDAYEDCSSQCG